MNTRRDFITLVLGAASSWPHFAYAQQSGQRRIGLLITQVETDEQGQLRVAALRQSLGRLGWTEGRNLRIDYRWAGVDVDRLRTFAAELVGLRPDALFASDTAALAALRQATRSIPIVLTQVSDPVGLGFVASLARPGGNITGFMPVEPPIAGKWLELLKGMAPPLKRAMLLFNPEVDTYAGELFRHAEAVAKTLTVELSAAAVHNDAEIEAAISALAHQPDGGLIVMPDAFTNGRRARIIALAAEGRVPTIYAYRFLAAEGGLIAYGIDAVVLFQQAATYIDRILRGEKPADLPVQAATKFELVINLRSAKAIGLDVSQDMLSIADEVIE
jgi:putative ABC transport system substrate-binding protein